MAWSVLAAAAVLLGAAIEAWVVLALGWRRAFGAGTAPPDPALPALVLGGPFAWVRHPQTLGMLLLVAAAALARRGAATSGLALLCAVLLIARARRDDRACAARFGDAYQRYRRAVPFLLPRRRQG